MDPLPSDNPQAASGQAPLQPTSAADAKSNAKPPTVASLANGRKPPPGFKFVVVRRDGKYLLAKQKLPAEGLGNTSTSSAPGKTRTTSAAGVSSLVKTHVAKEPFPKTESTPASTVTDVEAAKHATKDNAKNAKKDTPKDAAKDAALSNPAAETAEANTQGKGADTATTEHPTEPPLDNEAALRAQDLYFKKSRRHKFKTALLTGVGRGIGSATLDVGDLVGHHQHDGGNNSGPDDSDDDYDDTSTNGRHSHDDTRKGSHSNDPTDKSASTGQHVTFNPGAAASGMAQAAAGQAPRPPPLAHGAGLDAKGQGGKGGYKITNKDLDKLDEKLKQETETPLRRHWENFTFYLMASLSFILPTLFLILTIMIIVMKGKSINTPWGHMRDAIKVGVSAWPIVFAAVVAQAFKSYATFRVERGIRLMELEQLVGSSSFASAIKQPFTLRRVNSLLFFMLLVWCLSPIGSTALQRVYYLKRGGIVVPDTVYFVPQVGPNLMLSPGNNLDDNTYANEWQVMSTYFQGLFMPQGLNTDGASQDQYNHPLLRTINDDGHGNLSATYLGGAYGIPIAMPPSQVNMSGSVPTTQQAENDLSPFEIVGFNATTSFFNFTCNNPWQLKQYRELLALNNTLKFSPSGTLGFRLTSSNGTGGMDHIAFATNVNGTRTAGYDSNATDSAYFMYIECDFHQSFVDMDVFCDVSVILGEQVWTCRGNTVTPVPADQVKDWWHTTLADFSTEFVEMGSGASFMTPTTPIELTAETFSYQDGMQVYIPTEQYIQQSVTPADFALNFGYVFNTWTTLGFCPACVSINNRSFVEELKKNDTTRGSLYYPATAAHDLGQEIIYQLSYPWVWTMLASSIVLLLVGIASIVVESMLVAPDTLGYVSTAVRNSRYLHLPKTTAGTMSGTQRARDLGRYKVMMQDVKPDDPVGKIALGLKTDKAKKLEAGKLYR